jgi:phosphatidate cytidylyltransferase
VSGVSQQEAAPIPPAEKASRNLVTRVLAALVLVPLALAAVYAGSWFWLGLVVVAACGLFVEWLMIVGAASKTSVLAAGIVALVAAAACLQLGWTRASLGILATGVIVVVLLAAGQRGWVALGLGHASSALFASVLIRLDQVFGLSALMLVLLVVWMTDIGGYFAGRAIGGPKLWARVSPKKTWAGAIGGFVLSLAVAGGFSALGMGKLLPLLLLAAALSVASQIGDLFESAVKRAFGVKDSSHIIPGHGGLLDRLDGFVFAVAIAAAIGFLRGGADGVGRGLMVW